MIYYNDSARKTAKEKIGNLIAKLASTKPTDDFTLEDIRETLYYLKVLDSGLDSEIYAERRKRH